MQTTQSPKSLGIAELAARTALIAGLTCILWTPYVFENTLLEEVRIDSGLYRPLARIWGMTPSLIGLALMGFGQLSSLAAGGFRGRRWGGILTAIGAIEAVAVLLAVWARQCDEGTRFPLGAGWWLAAMVGFLAVGYEAWMSRNKGSRGSYLAVMALILAATAGAWGWKQRIHPASGSVIDNIDLHHEPYTVVMRGQHGSRPLTESDFVRADDGPNMAMANDLNGDSLHLDLTWERWGGEIVKRTVSAPLKSDVYTTFELSRTCMHFWPLYGADRIDTLAEFADGRDTTLVCTYLLPQSSRLVWRPTTAGDSFRALNPMPVDSTVAVPDEAPKAAK